MRTKLLGEYLVDGKLITLDQLQRALDLQILQVAGSDAHVGNILVQLGVIQEGDIATALEHQRSDRSRVVN